MKRVTIVLFISIILFHSIVFAEEMSGDFGADFSLIDQYETYNLYSEVIEAGDVCDYHDGYATYKIQEVRIRILDDRFKNKEFDIIYYLEDGMNTRLPLYDKLYVGDRVYAYGIFENNKLTVDSIAYYDKTPWIIGLCSIFALLIIIIGGKNGIKALISLAITILLIFGVLIPGILAGKNVLLLTVLICSLVILISFIIISGFTRKTLVAILGTICGILLAALLGGSFENAMRLSGINEHARMISVAIDSSQEMISFKNIMLSAIMISAMGACMDVGMSIASSINEIKKKKPSITKSELIKSGMTIGKDVMGTMTNTLILAYVGSAMLCILLYSINEFDLSFVLNAEDITDEILKSLCGSIGLIATIPITALIGGALIGGSKYQIPNDKKQEEVEIPVKYFNG